MKSSQVFLYDGWNMIGEFSLQNSAFILQRSYEWGPDVSGSFSGAGGVGGLILLRQPASAASNGMTPQTAFAPCYDGNGNVTELCALSTSTISARYEYSAFGETITADGSAIADSNPFRFSTKYEDRETGFYYYGYRYYAPETGRWLSRDPIGEQGGINLYGMVGNDAVNRTDYLGNIEFSEGVEELVKKYAQPQGGGYDFAADVPGTPMPLAFLPGAPMLRVIFTGTVNVNRCCKKDGGEGLYAYASGGLEAYLQWGWTWRSSKAQHTPFGPMEMVRPTPNKGYKERSFHGDVGKLAPCPEKRVEWVQWTLYGFLRGSVGAGVGLQGSFSSSVSQGEDFTFDTLWNNFNAQGSVAWGIAGGSVELGLGGNTTLKLLIK